MCGITGLLIDDPEEGPDLAHACERMTETLAHRGRDGEAIHVDDEAGLALGHRRLAVLDLTSSGDQPMRSPSGRYTIVYNGEIYNHLELRSHLEQDGHTFESTSDTETLLVGIEEWGLETTLERSEGMFAFGLWDEHEDRLTLARDRFGEKPLFYARLPDGIAFASELPALTAYPGFQAPIDERATADYFRYRYVPGPRTILEGVRKLSPGTFLHLEPGPSPQAEPRTYWSLGDTVRRARQAPAPSSLGQAGDELGAVLGDAVEGCLLSDVPIGLFLSGGLDSSTIAALAQERSPKPVETYSIGFQADDHDESQHARSVADHLGTDHTELTATGDDALEFVPELARTYGEPFGDPSAIPTQLVSRLAREHVTVALSGDGGDEIFGGYERYRWLERRWNQARRIPRSIRGPLAGALERVGAEAPAQALALPDRLRLYERRLSTPQPGKAADANDPPGLTSRHHPPVEDLDPVERAMYLDSVTYLPDDILVKVDRSSMAHTLETRAPILNHRVAQFTWRLPRSMRLESGTTKRVLRKVAYDHVPRRLLDRPKQGFGVPLDRWLRGPLRDWTDELLAPDRLASVPHLEPRPIREAWRDHQDGAERGFELWAVVAFQAWRQTFDEVIAG